MERIILNQWDDQSYERFMDQTFAALKVRLRSFHAHDGWTPREIADEFERLLADQLRNR